MPSRKPPPGTVWQDVKRLAGALRHEHEISLFILVSLFDILMTWILLSRPKDAGGVYFNESNPVAQFFLHHWGLKGMIYFKFFMVGFVCAIAEIVAHYRPRTGKFILQLGIVVVSVVVIYSLTLLLQAEQGGGAMPQVD